MLKIAVFADLHLTDNPDSVKLRVLDWALNEAKRCAADLIVGIGDLTATGTAVQTKLLFDRIQAAGLPFCSTPGNAELRDASNEAAKHDIPVPGGVPVQLFDTARDVLSDADAAKLAALPPDSGLLLATHSPVVFFQNPGKDALQTALANRAVTAVIAGHVHNDGPDVLRGLDPDKSAGGPPAVVFFTRQADGNWVREDHAMPGVDPADWTEAERKAFRDVLGLSCMYDPYNVLAEAAELGIAVAELRFGTWGNDFPRIHAALDNWRAHGGRILSMHLPSLMGDPAQDPVLAKSIQDAIELGCNRVTLHVPEVKAAQYDAMKDGLADRCCKLLAPLLEYGIDVGIENLHTVNGRCKPEERTFGCNIPECSDWLKALRDRTGSDLIGFHLDIGHARNNAPFSQTMNVSDYYNVPALPVNGFHFHQVRIMPDGTFKNHAPLEGFYEKLICLSGYFIARRTNLLNRNAPVILEVSAPGGGIASYKK